MLTRLNNYRKKTKKGLYPISLDMGISEFTLYKYTHPEKFDNLTSEMKTVIEDWIEVNC